MGQFPCYIVLAILLMADDLPIFNGSNGAAWIISGVSMALAVLFLVLWLRARQQGRPPGVLYSPGPEDPERGFNQYFESLPMLTAYFDREKRYRFGNRYYLELVKQSSQDIYGKTAREVLGEDIYGQVHEKMEDALQGEAVSFQITLPFREKVYEAFATFIPQLDKTGSTQGFFSLIQDVTKRTILEQDLQKTRTELEDEIKERARELEESNKRLQDEVNRRQETSKALEKSEQQFRTIFESSPITTLILAQGSLIEKASKAVVQVLGYEPSELTGTTLNKLIHAEDGDQDGLVFQELLDGKCEHDVRERRFLKKDGRAVWCNQTLALMDNGPGDRVIALLEDITQRKEMELELSKRAVELSRSNEELEQFAFVASHDLNEPLDKIVAFGKLLEEECGEVLNEEGREYLDYMRDASKRMQELIASLLDLSLVTTKGKPFRHVDLNKVIGFILSDYKLRIEDAEATITVEKLPFAQADEVQIRQLFQNLIGNALKFHIPDLPPEITISGDVFKPRAGSGFDPSKSYCKIIVRDKGIGFEQRNAERIFNPLQRLHPRSAYSGTGIGLAICRKIVDRHGGVIAAKSSPGKGTVFAIMLPQSEQLE